MVEMQSFICEEVEYQLAERLGAMELAATHITEVQECFIGDEITRQVTRSMGMVSQNVRREVAQHSIARDETIMTRLEQVLVKQQNDMQKNMQRGMQQQIEELKEVTRVHLEKMKREIFQEVSNKIDERNDKTTRRTKDHIRIVQV